MNGRQAKALRQTEARAVSRTARAVQPVLDAALTNERLTRQRVEELERRVEKLVDWAERMEKGRVTPQSVAGWMRWLLTGKSA